MAVEVVREGGDSDTYESATKWHIDEHRILHVVGAKGNLAAYATGTWWSAHLKGDRPATLEQVVHDALIDRTSDHEWVDTVGPHVVDAIVARFELIEREAQ